VILVDANLLLYAANRAAPEHEEARRWLDDRLSGPARVGLPWPSLLAVLRLASNPLVMRNPAPVPVIWTQIQDWLNAGAAWTPVPTERHREIVGGFLTQSWMTPRLVPDAHLAALAIEHGLVLCSTDGDFARFPGLTWQNPLGAAGAVTNAV
jgi:toxin-antitoxin system PIN domain toxin